MVSLYKDPEGKHVFDNDQKQNNTSTMGTSTTNTNTIKSREQDPKIQQLESQVSDLEKKLRDYVVSLTILLFYAVL